MDDFVDAFIIEEHYDIMPCDGRVLRKLNRDFNWKGPGAWLWRHNTDA